MVEKDVKNLLRNCLNYERIVNFDYLSDDLITAKLIKVYRDYVFKTNFSNYEDLERLRNFDYVLGKYIDDYAFRKELRKEIVHVKIKKSCTDILRAIVEGILKIFDNYMESSTRKITIARWIQLIFLVKFYLFCYNLQCF